MSAVWGEMKVTACTPHAGKQSINSAISQDVKPCGALLPSIDVCSVSGPPRQGKEGVSKHAASVA